MLEAPLGLLVLLGAVAAVDGAALGQFMVSRPLVLGILSGWLVGDVNTGLLVGAVLELFFLPAVPVGGGRVPEPGPSTVVAVAGAAAAGVPSGFALAVCLGLLWSVLGGLTQERVRAFYQPALPEPGAPDLAAAVTRAQLMGIGLEAFRGAALTFAGLTLVSMVGPAFGAHWPLPVSLTILALLLCSMVPLGSLLATLGGLRRRGGWVIIGIGLGVLAGGVF